MDKIKTIEANDIVVIERAAAICIALTVRTHMRAGEDIVLMANDAAEDLLSLLDLLACVDRDAAN